MNTAATAHIKMFEIPEGYARNGVRLATKGLLRNGPAVSSLSAAVGCVVFSLGFVLIMAGLAFGGAVTVVGFGGLLVTSLHRRLGSPLPIPTLHNAFERRLYVLVGLSGLALWGSAFWWSLTFTP